MISRNIVFDNTLRSTEKLIFYTIRNIIHETSRNQFSIQFIAQCAGVCTRTVIRCIKALEESRWIQVFRAPKNSRICNTYMVIESHTQSVLENQPDPQIGSELQEQTTCDSNEYGLSEAQWGILKQKYGEIRIKSLFSYAFSQKSLKNPTGFAYAVLSGKTKTVDLDGLEQAYKAENMTWAERFFASPYSKFAEY